MSRRRPEEPAPVPLIQVPSDFEAEFPGGSALATECFMNFGVVAGTVQGALTAFFGSEGIPSMAAFNVLTIVEGSPSPVAPSTIAQRMVVSRPTITGILDTLERKHLIRRAPSRDDARMKVVSLTASGRATVRRMLPLVHDFERRVLGGLTVDRQRQLLDLLARMQQHLGQLAPEVTPGIRD